MLGENRFALWTEQSITFAGQSVQRTTPTSPPLPIAQNSTKISIDNRKSIMLCNKLTHTHPLGCISPDKRSGVSTTKPSLLAQRPGRCHRDQGPCACPSLGSGREVSLQPTRVPQVFRVGRTPTPSLAVACCCTHTWEEVPEAAPCQPARISSSVEVPVKRCLLSLKSMVLSALLQLIYS